MKGNLMYTYDRKLSGSQFRSKEQPITSWPAQRNSYYPDRVVSGVLGRGGINSEYVWAHEGLAQGPSAFPSRFLWGAKTFSTNLESSFQRAIIAARNNVAFSHLPDPRTIPIAIMALDAGGSRPVAGQREFEMFYSGSLLKVAAMYAAFQLVHQYFGSLSSL